MPDSGWDDCQTSQYCRTAAPGALLYSQLLCVCAGVGAKRSQRTRAITLDFKPVNYLLQNVYQVG